MGRSRGNKGSGLYVQEHIIIGFCHDLDHISEQDHPALIDTIDPNLRAGHGGSGAGVQLRDQRRIAIAVKERWHIGRSE